MNGRIVITALAAACALALAACGDSDDSGTATGTPTGGTTGDTNGGTQFEAGQFQLTTHAVDDKCLDGGLDLLFQPDGSDTPYDFTNLTEFPAYADLPKTYDIQLQAPFATMTVTVEADGAGKMKVQDAQQIGVLVNEDSYGDCMADMTIDADITIVDNDNLDMNAVIEVTNWRSAADMKCPPLTAGTPDPCPVTLTIKGARK